MTLEEKILIDSSYHIHKGFQKHIPDPVSYLIKTLGLDCIPKESKKHKKKLCLDAARRGPNEKFFLFAEIFLPKKKRRRKTKLKKKRHEEVEEAV